MPAATGPLTHERSFSVVPIVPLYGHVALRERLRAAVVRGNLPASLLFHGPAGVGKQRLALWLAQALVCASPSVTGESCGRCLSCRYAVALAHPDVHWFFPRPRLKDTDPSTDEVVSDYRDAITERANASGLYAAPGGSEGIYVATVRAIVQLASVSPAMAQRKVFIIGDAERMVPQEGSDFAANALLKVLEEPPANTHLILTSSEPGALLPTIRSRVVNVRVAPLSSREVEAFVADPAVADALRPRAKAKADPVTAAEGAPGRLIGTHERATAIAGAERLLETALSGDRSKTVRAAMAQGSTKARGLFSDTLDELTVLLAERSRSAAGRGDERTALGASRAIAFVENAKTLATGNVNPSLITAVLLRDLTSALSGGVS